MAVDAIRALYVGGPLDGEVYTGKGYDLVPADVPVPVISDASVRAGYLPHPGRWRFDQTLYRREAICCVNEDDEQTELAELYVAADHPHPRGWSRPKLHREWTRALLAGCVVVVK